MMEIKEPDTVEEKHWYMIDTDNNMNMYKISNSITTQEELADIIVLAFADEMSIIVQDEIVFGSNGIAWLEMNAMADKLPINQLASDLSNMTRKNTAWPHPLRGNVAFINRSVWNTFE